MLLSSTESPISHRRGETAFAVGCLLLWLLVAMPLFLRMPLTNDTELFDLQASSFRSGSVLYRDFLEPNLPGVVWGHLLVRSIAGESAEAMRGFDLMIFGITASLAGRLVCLAGGSRAAAVWTVFGMSGFYLTASEWCHCQRDVWMLCPALAAVSVRHFSLKDHGFARFRWSMIEGLLWGTAIWLKPHVVVPAALVWVVTIRCWPNWQCLLADVCGLLTGGLVMGGLGIGWMMSVGCWQPFLETLRDWNPGYFRAGRNHWELRRFMAMVLRFGPWYVFHLTALTAIGWCWRLRGANDQDGVDQPRNVSTLIAMIAALSVGWTLQAVLLQHLFDYVHAPTILLAILFASVVAIRIPTMTVWGPRLALMLVLAVAWTSPTLRIERLGQWAACWQRTVSPELRDTLARFPNPNRQNLAEIAAFLRTEAVADREVCFYNSDLVSLYRQLQLLPPVRYTYLFETIQFFPDRRQEILAELQQSSPRFVVTDLVSVGMPYRDAIAVGPDGPRRPPPAYRRAPTDVYPWSCPVVYRAGTYLIHHVPAGDESTQVANRLQSPQ